MPFIMYIQSLMFIITFPSMKFLRQFKIENYEKLFCQIYKDGEALEEKHSEY